jgi:hypothetical protein
MSSIKKIEYSKEIVSPRKIIVISNGFAQNIANANGAKGSQSFNVNLQTLGLNFAPKYCTINQVIYCNNGTATGTDQGIFNLWCSLTGDYVCAVYVGVQGIAHSPDATLILQNALNTITFRLDAVIPTSTTAPVINSYAPSGYLSLVLDFWT